MFTDECAVYDPEELALLGAVLDQVVQSLPLNLRTPYNRIALAQNILACASTGERDPAELARAALMDSQVCAAACRELVRHFRHGGRLITVHRRIAPWRLRACLRSVKTGWADRPRWAGRVDRGDNALLAKPAARGRRCGRRKFGP